jgi:hypothetical protein
MEKPQTKTILELVKEIRTGKLTYWVKVNHSWSFAFDTLEEAEAKYEWCLRLDQEDSIEILKTNI